MNYTLENIKEIIENEDPRSEETVLKERLDKVNETLHKHDNYILDFSFKELKPYIYDKENNTRHYITDNKGQFNYREILGLLNRIYRQKRMATQFLTAKEQQNTLLEEEIRELKDTIREMDTDETDCLTCDNLTFDNEENEWHCRLGYKFPTNCGGYK